VGHEEGAVYLSRALETYESALRVFSRTSQARAWATVQHNYGSALKQLADRTPDGSEIDMLDHAAASLRQALEVRTQEALPEDWATSQRVLGDILTERGRLSEDAEAEVHLRRAVEAYQQTRGVVRAKNDPMDFARLLLTLGTAQARLAEVVADRQEARSLLDQSLWELTTAMGTLAQQGRRRLEGMIAEQMEIVQQQRRIVNAAGSA
jgi:tetratricopeptide (TPR) repeat protein